MVAWPAWPMSRAGRLEHSPSEQWEPAVLVTAGDTAIAGFREEHACPMVLPSLRALGSD